MLAQNAQLPPHFYNSIKESTNPNINSLPSNIYYPTILPHNHHQILPHQMPYVFVQANDVNRNASMVDLNGRQVGPYQINGKIDLKYD